MYLQSITHALPSASFTQAECWQILENNPEVLERLRPRSIELLRKLLLNPDGAIQKRHFCATDFDRIFEMDGGYLNSRFEAEAPRLAEQALGAALEQAAITADDLDALFVCTCTGYLCPGISSYLSERLGMNPGAYLNDLVGLGCGAAIPMLRSASGFSALHPDARIACVAVEVCSTAFYLDNDPGVLVSLCLFGDGASASVWGGRPPIDKPAYKPSGFQTIHRPEDREKIRFRNQQGCLRNQLHRSVPSVAAEAVAKMYQESNADGSTIVSHGGGRDVVEAIEARLGVPRLDAAHQVLEECGNLSSPSVMLAAERVLGSSAPPESLWLTSFGAGFAAHSVFLNQV